LVQRVNYNGVAKKYPGKYGAVLRVCTGAQEQATGVQNGVKWMLHGKSD
jgi:hypothetical protein